MKLRMNNSLFSPLISFWRLDELRLDFWCLQGGFGGGWEPSQGYKGIEVCLKYLVFSVHLERYLAWLTENFLAKVKQQTILRQSTQTIFQRLLKTTLVDFCVVWQTICRLSRPLYIFLDYDSCRLSRPFVDTADHQKHYLSSIVVQLLL